MNITEAIGIIVIALFVTVFTFGMGMELGIPKRIRDEKLGVSSLPGWLQIVIFLVVYLLEIGAGLLLRENYWLVCGTWLISGFILGLLTERFVWAIVPQKYLDKWLEKRRNEKTAKDARSLLKIEAEKPSGIMKGAEVVGTILGLFLVAAMCYGSWLAVPTVWEWAKNRFFAEKPWLGLYYENNRSSTAEDKTFETLVECRQWANEQAERDGKETGEWDYSCGYNCEFTNDPLRRMKPGINYDCDNVTK